MVSVSILGRFVESVSVPPSLCDYEDYEEGGKSGFYMQNVISVTVPFQSLPVGMAMSRF